MEIGQDDPIDAAIPGVIGGLSGVIGVEKINIEVLRLEQEARHPFDLEGIIDTLLTAAKCRYAPAATGFLASHFGVVAHIPAERREERVDEVGARGRFGVRLARGAVELLITLDERLNFASGRFLHGVTPLSLRASIVQGSHPL